MEPDTWAAWLGEGEGGLEALMRALPDGTLRLWPVSADVNSLRHNRSDLGELIVRPDAPWNEYEAGPESA